MKDEAPGPADIFDEKWEARARQMLAVAGLDPELGIRAARDSLRVIAGDLTEADFHARLHEDYLREFGADERPLGLAPAAPIAVTAPPAGDESCPAAPPPPNPDDGFPKAVSRRQALSFAGGGAGALLVGGLLGSSAWAGSPAPGGAQSSLQEGDEEDAATGRPVRWGMVIDLERCTGCLACVDGCREENGLSDGVFWIYSLPFSDENREDVNFLVRPCMHCSNAPCVKVCPVAARHVRDSDGLVLTDYDICIGCRYCEVSCPYGVNYFQWGEPSSYGGTFSGERRDERGRSVLGDPPKGVMGKCTFCPQRVDDPDSRGTAACALACPHDVIHIGDLNDPESAPMLYLAGRRQENPGLSTFRLLDQLGTEPNIIYIGQEPSERARPSKPPTSYEDWGFVEDRRAVLEGPEPWFNRIVGR